MTDTVIWDWNGTLLDDVHICIASVNRLLSRRNLEPVTLERYHQTFRFPVRNYYEEIGFDLVRESFADVAVEYHDAYEDLVSHASLHDGVPGTLELLRTSGLRQVVLSALEEGRLVNELEKRGIHHFFERAFGLEDLEAGSKIGRGRQLLDEIKTGAERCCLIGDTEHDAEVAAELGMRCILVSCGHNPAARLQKTGHTVCATIPEAVGALLPHGSPASGSSSATA